MDMSVELAVGTNVSFRVAHLIQHGQVLLDRGVGTPESEYRLVVSSDAPIWGDSPFIVHADEITKVGSVSEVDERHEAQLANILEWIGREENSDVWTKEELRVKP